jgi:hypothetical protein
VWFRCRKVADNCSFYHARVASEVDTTHRQLKYRQSDVPAMRQMSEQSKMPFNELFSIIEDKKTLEQCGNVSRCRLTVAIPTHPHPEKNCIMTGCLLLSPPGGPSAMNYMNCLFVELKRCHWYWYRIVPDVFCVMETSEGFIVSNIVCDIGQSLETPSNVFCSSPFGFAYYSAK